MYGSMVDKLLFLFVIKTSYFNQPFLNPKQTKKDILFNTLFLKLSKIQCIK